MLLAAFVEPHPND